MTKKRIMIVDDDASNLKLIKTILDSEGYDCVCKKNGQEAIDSVSDYKPDLLLIDVMMPVMDGFELTRKLKSNLETIDIPVILITALSDRDARLQGLESGAEEFVNKPFVKQELMMRVRNLLRLKEYNDMVAKKR